MNNEGLYIFSETIPNWLMALSAVSAAILFWWRKQDRKEAFELRKEEITNAVNAVWVAATINGEPSKWGVLVTNSLQSPIKNIVVNCTGNSNSTTLSHPDLPPGEHFFESLGRLNGKAWELPTSNVGRREYITASSKHRVQRLEFSYLDGSYVNELSAKATLPKSSKLVNGTTSL